MMSSLGFILSLLAAFECFYIMYIETIATTSNQTSRIFGIPIETLKNPIVSTLLKNQGVYNGVVGVGILIGCIFNENTLLLFSLISMVGVALYGGLTSNRSIIYKQGALPFVALVAQIISLCKI